MAQLGPRSRRILKDLQHIFSYVPPLLRQVGRLIKWLARHFWEWPRRVKVIIIIAVAVVIVASMVVKYVRHDMEVRQLYNVYFPGYFEEYKKRYPVTDAYIYASHYAWYYAEYFTSDVYREAVEYGLPEPTKAAFSYPESSPVAEFAIRVDGVQFIKQFEGFQAEPYRDVGGKLTVGYGHLLRRGEKVDALSEQEAEQLLAQDIRLAEAAVKRMVKVSLQPHQFSALVSLVYNIGPRHFAESTLLEQLNGGNFEDAADEFLRWDYVKKERVFGLTRRREAERALFLG